TQKACASGAHGEPSRAGDASLSRAASPSAPASSRGTSASGPASPTSSTPALYADVHCTTHPRTSAHVNRRVLPAEAIVRSYRFSALQARRFELEVAFAEARRGLDDEIGLAAAVVGEAVLGERIR